MALCESCRPFSENILSDSENACAMLVKPFWNLYFKVFRAFLPTGVGNVVVPSELIFSASRFGLDEVAVFSSIVDFLVVEIIFPKKSLRTIALASAAHFFAASVLAAAFTIDLHLSTIAAALELAFSATRVVEALATGFTLHSPSAHSSQTHCLTQTRRPHRSGSPTQTTRS